jgi:putative CocE/NonD family hydrolase
MGPWAHGGWSRSDGDRLGGVHFGDKTSVTYREKIELEFFDRFLKGRGGEDLAEATVYETGANRWRTFDSWPPAGLQDRTLVLGSGGTLSFGAVAVATGAGSGGDDFDEFVSDPAKPAPYTEAVTTGMTREYMTDDQRFAARRPDVLAYQTAPLEEDVTIAGPIRADLWVSTSGGDSDWIVKLIDVFPGDTPNYDDTPPGKAMGGYEMMVRSEAIRGRFRKSNAKPEPFVANEPTSVPLELQDVLHTFQRGHRIMVQIQCTWFPLVDRNPQKWVDNVFEARAEDFVRATQRVYRSPDHTTELHVGVLPR